jgi:WD40 repeat protein
VIALDLDEKYLYSGSYDFTAIRWNISSGTIEKHYVGHTSFMLSIQVGPALLFSGSLDFLVGVWNKEDAISVKFFRCKLYSSINCIVSTEVNAVTLYDDDVLIVGFYGLDLVQISTAQILARQIGLR